MAYSSFRWENVHDVHAIMHHSENSLETGIPYNKLYFIFTTYVTEDKTRSASTIKGLPGNTWMLHRSAIFQAQPWHSLTEKCWRTSPLTVCQQRTLSSFKIIQRLPSPFPRIFKFTMCELAYLKGWIMKPKSLLICALSLNAWCQSIWIKFYIIISDIHTL